MSGWWGLAVHLRLGNFFPAWRAIDRDDSQYLMPGRGCGAIFCSLGCGKSCLLLSQSQDGAGGFASSSGCSDRRFGVVVDAEAAS